MENVDDILVEIGGLGKFQIMVLFFLYTAYGLMGWSMMTMSFAGMIPRFECVVENATRSAPAAVNTNGQHLYASNTSAALDNLTDNVCYINGETCDSYKYYFDDSAITIINEWDIVCDRLWIKRLVTSLQLLGVFLGAVASGYLGGILGRKKVHAGFFAHHFLVCLLASFSTSWQMFAVCRLLIGIGIGGHFVVIYPYCLEFFPPKSRVVMTAVPAFNLGVITFSGAAYLLHDWSYLHMAVAACHVPYFFSCWYFPDSPRWLAVNGRLSEAEAALGQIARMNGKPLPAEVQTVLKSIMYKEQEERASGKRYSYIDLFRTWKMAKISLTICYAWTALNIIYYGISFGLSRLSGNIYLNIFLATVIEIPSGLLVVYYLCDRIGRRRTGILLFSLSTLGAASCLLNEFVSPPGVRETALRVLSKVTRMMVGCAWSVILIWGVELYPTVTRNLGYGLANTWSRVGGILCPYIINLDTMMVESYVIMTLAMLLTVILVFPLPETKDKALADSLNDEKDKDKALTDSLNDEKGGVRTNGTNGVCHETKPVAASKV